MLHSDELEKTNKLREQKDKLQQTKLVVEGSEVQDKEDEEENEEKVEQVTDAEEDEDEENLKMDGDKDKKGTDGEEDDGNSKIGDDKDAKETGKQGTDAEEENEENLKRGEESAAEKNLRRIKKLEGKIETSKKEGFYAPLVHTYIIYITIIKYNI